MPNASSNWTHVLAECLAALEREQIGSPCPIVDHEIGKISPDAEDIAVWLICRTKAEQRAFADTELARSVSTLKKKMLAAGLPEPAVTGLTVRITSREEIEQHGGRIATLRG